MSADVHLALMWVENFGVKSWMFFVHRTAPEYPKDVGLDSLLRKS